jgi:thiosulfate/3-mercaptopyruvate sulfurtransferase
MTNANPDAKLEELPQPLVSTEWLATNLGQPGLKVVDGSWYLPAMNRDPRAEFLAGHIPGAVWFDIDDIADHSTDLPHTLPSNADFAAKVGALGISNADRIVVYDGGGIFSAPRVRWMLKKYGAAHVALLDGGLPKWKAEGRALKTGAGKPSSASFKANLDNLAWVDLKTIAAELEGKSAQVADARSRPRFDGAMPEPRPGIAAGHMPGAVSLPMTELVADGRLKPVAELKKAIAAAGIDPVRPVITSCGSGVSATVINLAFEVSGYAEPRLFDGSWTEWASKGMPVEKSDS